MHLETEIKVLNEIVFIMLEMRRYSHLDSSLRLMYEVFGKVHDLMVYSDENDHGGESEKFSSLIDCHNFYFYKFSRIPVCIYQSF